MPRPLTEAEIEAEKAYILSTSAPMPGPLTEAEKEKQRADAPPLGIPRYVPPDAPADSDLPREGPALGMDKYDSASSTRELADAKRDQAIQERIRAQHGEDRPEELVQAEIKRELDRYGILGPLGPVDPETAENLEDAYTSPDTLAKKRARMAAGAFPIPIREPGAMERDARWQPGATKLSQEGVLSLVSGISAKHAEPSPAEEVVDKSWARALARSATSAATGLFAGLSPVDSAVRWFTGGEYDIPLVPSLGETFALPSKLADVREGLEGLTTDPDVRLDPVKVASRVVLALAGGEGVSAQLKVLGADPDEVAIWDEAIERATPIPEFDAAWKALYEEGDSSAMEEVPYHSLPASLQGGLDLALVRRAVTPGGALYDRPEAALLQRAVERGEDELLVEREASELPISVLRWLSPLSVPTNKQITDEGQKRAKMQELTGIGDTAKAVRLLTAMTVDKEDGQLYFTPSPIQRALSWAGVTGEVLWEADIPLNIGGVNLGSLVADALGYEQLARMIGTARIPTKAGWETWVATGSLDPYLHERGWRGSRAPLLRPGAETTWMGRVGANVAFADYQGPGLADALRRQGEPPQSALSKFALAVDVAVDVLMPIDELVFGGLATPAVGARRAWVAGNTASRAGLRGGRLAKAAAAGVVPALVGETDRLGALDKVVREGLDAELRAGHRLFGENVRGDKPPPPHEDPGSVDWKLQRDIARKIEAAGYRPEEAAAAVNAVADENARELWNATARGLKNRGGPADVALRTAPGYAAVRARYDDLAAAGNVTPRQADVTMAMLESLAWKAGGEGKYATPEEFFDAHAVELGGTPGAGAYLQGEGTPEFARWFGASKVVDAEGKPLVVYHGTDADWMEFDDSRALSSMGLHVGTPEQVDAVRFTGGTKEDLGATRPLDGQRVMPLYVKIDKPLRMEDGGDWYPWRIVDNLASRALVDSTPLPANARELAGLTQPHMLRTWEKWSDARKKIEVYSRQKATAWLEDHPSATRDEYRDVERKAQRDYVRDLIERYGYDGIVYDNMYEGGGDSYIAFRPEQIKSATANRGTFDPTDPSILRDPSGGPAAAATYTPPVPPADLPPRLAADTWGDTRGPLGWWMPLDEVEDALHGLVEEFIVLYDGAGRQVARWGPEDTRVAGADPAVNCVVYSSALDALARPGDGVYTHVHPSGAPFSPEDLLVARRANVAEIRAVADGDGFTWVVKRPTGGWPDPAAMQSAYNEAAVPATGVATRQMDDIVRAAGGDITNGRNARGYDKQTWRRLYARALSDTWNDAFARTGIVAERVPNRGAERMGAGVRPAGDAPGAGPEALDLAARRGATPVGEQVTLLEPTAPAFPPRKAGTPLFERRAAAVLGSIEPTSVARWLLRYFATADIGTVLHENAHLMRFVMGDKWVDELVRFLPNEPDPARPGKLRLTRAGEERFAEGFGRLLRGKIAPRGRLRAYYDEFKDRLADLWMRLRGLPLGVSPDLRRWFDAAFNPGGPLKRVLIDRPVTPEGRLPGRPVRTTVEADVPTRLEAEGVKRTGQVLGDVSTMDSPGAAIDVVAGSRSAREIDAVQAAINAIADTVVETARRQWGFTGDVTKLTRRTHVPKARVERVLRKVDNLFRAIHGKDLVVEADAVRLDPVSAAKMEAHVAMLADSGMGFEALRGSDLLDPDYDFTEMPLEDYNRIREATIDRDAGPGTRADRVAAQNVGNAAYGLLKFISDSGPAGGAIAGAAVGTVVAGPGAGTLIGALGGAFLYSERASGEIKAAFTVNFRVAEYTNPTVVDLFGETTRELGGITGLFKRALDDVGRTNPEAMRHELVTRIARSMPAMSVQVPDIPEMLDLHRVWVEPFTERVAKEPVLADLLATLDNVAGFVARNPAIARTTQESEQQAVLALAGYRADPRDIGLLAPTERAAIEDAVGILHDALRRRGEAVKKAGAEIGIAMSGSDEKKLWVGLHRDKNPWAQLEKAAEFYQKFYDGDWNGILKETAAVGQATAPPAFDPVAAAAAAITRMMALDVLNRFATKMMDAGIALDVDTAARLGRQFETFRPIGSTDASGLDRAAFRDEVLRVIQAEMSFKMIGADVVDMAHRKKVASDPAPGTLGSFSPDAYRVGLSILSSWGFKPGADTAWKALVLGDGTEVMVPEGLWGELTGVMDRAAKAGLAWAARGEAQPVLGRWYNVEGIAQKMEGAKATVTGAVAARAADREDTLNRRVARVAQGILDVAGWSYTMSRVNMVTGVGIPNPANFIGNLLGGAVQLYEGKGAIGALRVLGRYVAPTASGKVLRHVFLSLFNDYRGIRAPGLWRPSAVWIDGRGGVHTGESLANQARKTGLHSSQARAESTWKLVDALRRDEGTRWKRITKDFSENNPMGAAMRQFVVRPFNWWQDALMEASTAIDNLYRVGSFIDELSIGKGVDEAAETARRVAFDYNAVTDFEREVIRPAVMFYTYMRRNLDLQWWTLLNHPSRFLGTLRGIRDAQEIVLGKESELIWPEYLDGRLILAMRKTASDSNQYGAYSGVARIAPLIGVSDAVVLMARILGTVTGDAEGRRELMAMLSPWYQSVIVAATGYDIWSGRDVAAFNTVPAWLVELDQQAFDGLLTTDLFDVDAMEERDPMSEANPGESHFQARNARYWWAFRNLMPIGGGRTVDTVTAMARADWLAFAFEGGIVTAAVEAAQEHRASGRARLTDPLVSLVRDGIDWLPGINPYPDRSYAPSAAPDVEERRVGMKESEELGGLFAIKSVRVPTRVLRLDDLSKKSAREAEAAARLQERSEPY